MSYAGTDAQIRTTWLDARAASDAETRRQDVQTCDYVVDVHSVVLFKTRLDKFWMCQDVVFDWKADLTGTGDRSESSVLSV